MSLLDKNLAGDILDEALSTGGDFAEVFVEKTQGEDIFLSERQVKKISSGMHYGVGIRVFLGTFQTYAHTNILTRDNLLAAARNAARGIKGQAAAKAADLAPVAIADQNPVLIYPRDVDKRDKIVLLQEVSELVYAQSPLIEQVAANIKAEDREILIANSDGVWAEDRQVRSRFNLSAMALRDGIKEQSRRGFAKMCGYELFDSFPGGREAFAADVAERRLPGLMPPMPLAEKCRLLSLTVLAAQFFMRLADIVWKRLPFRAGHRNFAEKSDRRLPANW